MASSNSGAAASILGKIQTGVGFANYTAHCSADGWADPSLSRANIASFNNAGKYPFMIGNCCQSFMFGESDSFGEMLLYTANEGAVGYIGTSQYSYWYEDAWWGMGNTSLTLNATNWASHTYANTGLGAYDGVWHINGEAYSNWYYSGRQMVHKGNVAVQASTSGYKQYYWEIYHLVGDPSLIPYTTQPEALSLSFATPMQGATSLTVTTEPYTYVAISKSNVLLDAEWSGSGTSVTLTVPAFTGETYCVVGTKQDRSPYINESVVPVAANPPVAAFSGTPTTILEGQSVTFTDASQYPASWSWNFGDSQTSTVQNPVHTYTTAGTYTVSLTVTNGMGSDVETKTNYITVNPNTNPPTANFSADLTTVAIGGTVNFTDLSINNPSSWAWSFDGGTPISSTIQNPAIVYNTPGTYQVSLTATNAYGSDVETKLAYITVSLPDYCAAASNSTAYERITNFTCNTINNTSTSTA
jgi:PKD repeat protein